MGYRIPVRTLPPSLVLVKRLFLSGKSISGNITHLLTILHLLLIVNSRVLIDHFSFCRARVGVLVLMLWDHTHKTVLPEPAETNGKTYKGQFLYLMLQVIYAFSDKMNCINNDHPLFLWTWAARYGAHASAFTRTILSWPGPAERTQIKG